jgi:hypothetical protein
MPTRIRFYKLKPQYKKKRLGFRDTKKMPWKDKFEAPRTPDGIVGDGVRFLLATLDSGYGNDVFASSIFGPWNLPSWRGRIRLLIMARWLLLWSCIEVHSAFLNIRRHKIASKIEQSDKTVIGYILGGAGARLAIEESLSKGGRNLDRFLHRSIFTHPAVAPSSPTKKGRSAPDYLVMDDGEMWHTVEAKGSLVKNEEDWGILRTGLRQALNIKEIQWSANPATPPSSCSCMFTYFLNKDGEPRIAHVDPPPSDAETTIVFSATMADIVAYERSLFHGDALIANSDERFKEDAPPLNGFRWAKAAGASIKGTLWLGIAKVLEDNREAIHDSVAVGQFFASELSDLSDLNAVDNVAPGEAFNVRAWHSLLMTLNARLVARWAGRLEERVSERISGILGEARRFKTFRVSKDWMVTMDVFLSIRPESGEMSSITELHATVADMLSKQRTDFQAAMSESPKGRVSSAMSRHGLAVFALQLR